MTTDQDKIIALREEADKFATNELSCEGEYHPDFHTVSDERFYAIAFDNGRQAEREECAKVCEEIRVIVDGNHQWTALHVQDQCIKAIRARSTK